MRSLTLPIEEPAGTAFYSRFGAVLIALFLVSATVPQEQQSFSQSRREATSSQPRLVIQQGHLQDITSVAFSPNGQLIITGSRDRTARLWDAVSGAEIRQFEGHSGDVWAVAFSPNGRSILTGGQDNARLWDIATGQEIRRFEFPIPNTLGVDVRSVAFSPNGEFLVLGRGQGSPAPPMVPGETVSYK